MLAIRNHIKEHQRRNPISVLVLAGVQGRSQYEANRGTRLGKILPNTVDFYFFYQTDNIRRFHTADFVQRTVCSPRL